MVDDPRAGQVHPEQAGSAPKRDAHGFTDAEHDTLIVLIDRNAKRVQQMLTLRAAAGDGAPDEPGDDDLTELRRLDAAATPGPWPAVAITGQPDTEDEGICLDFTTPGNGFDFRLFTDADTALIPAMRNALPGLLTEVERLRAAASKECEPYEGTGDCGYCDGDGCGAPRGVPAGGKPAGDLGTPHCSDGVCTACNGSGLRAAAPASEDDERCTVCKGTGRVDSPCSAHDCTTNACLACNGTGRAAGPPPPTPAWQGIFDAQQAKVDRQKVYDDVFSELSTAEGFDGTDDAEHDRLHDLTERILALTSAPPTPAPTRERVASAVADDIDAILNFAGDTKTTAEIAAFVADLLSDLFVPSAEPAPPLWTGETRFLGSRNDPVPDRSWLIGPNGGGFTLPVPPGTAVEVRETGRPAPPIVDEPPSGGGCGGRDLP